MSALSGKGNPNELTQQLKSRSPVPSSFVGEESNPEDNELPHQFNSHANSQRNVEEGVGCFGPNACHVDLDDQASEGRIQNARKPRLTPAQKGRSHLYEAGKSAQACIGKKRKPCEPTILTKEQQEIERKKKKRKTDQKYRANNKMKLADYEIIKPVYNRLMKIASICGGIDKMESYLDQSNSMNSESVAPRQKEVEQLMSKYGGIDKMESILDRFEELKSKYGGSENLEYRLDKFKDMEAEFRKLNQMKSKFGIQETESILDKFKEMEAKLSRFHQEKSSFVGIDEIESGINSLKTKELQSEKHKQMVNQKDLEPFPESPGSRWQMEMDEDEWYRQQQKEKDYHQFEQMKSKFGGTEEMELKLEKFQEMEAEINRLKEIEVQLHDYLKQKELPSLQESSRSLKEKSGSQLFDLNVDPNMVSDQCGINLNSPAVVSGTTPDMQYSDVFVDQLIAEVTDENVASDVDPDSFRDSLDGECESVGKFKIPPSLVSTARDIFKVHGDITKKSKFSVHIVQTVFVSFCAATKDMGDRSLEEITEKIIWKWRGPIMDAKRSEFDVEFAMKHLTTIVQGYFGLKAREDHDSLEQRMVSLRAVEETLRKELEKTSSEIKAVEAKQRDLTSEKCKICLESADKFSGKMVGIYI